MALVLKDRVRESSSTSGTGTITLAGAATGFDSFASIGDGNTTYYAIIDTIAGEWEVGLGTYTASGTTLSRDTVLESSNSDTLVNFAANSKDVICTYPADKSVFLSADGSLSLPGALSATGAVTGSNLNVSNWDTAYGWGDHSTVGYLTSYTETDPVYTASSWYATTNNASNWDTAYGWGNHASAGYLTSYTETDPIYTASSWHTTTNNSSNWDTAYGWGDHASAGYISDTGSQSMAGPLTVTGNVTCAATYFEGGNHVIVANDGGGNFNIRVANTFSGGCTEAGYVSHWKYTQSSGLWDFNVSTASLAIGVTPTWQTAFSIAQNGNVTALGDVTAYSDERLKENWKDLPEGFVANLAYVKSGTYNRIDLDGKQQVGVSAQSLQTVLPDAVIESNDTLAVNYGNAALASAIELAKKVVELEARIRELEGK